MNRAVASGVSIGETAMDSLVEIFPDAVANREQSLRREFDECLTDCPALAYRVALGVLRNHAEAEDVAQNALLKAFRSFHRLRDRSKFRAWIVRITWRMALDHRRAFGRRSRYEQASEWDSRRFPPMQDTVNREFENRVASAVEDLPEKFRIVVILAAIHGYDTREAASMLGIPEGTVKSRLHFARKRLAESLR
jgi:RNA polymerase sigma-70 factor (ECF subfamily)